MMKTFKLHTKFLFIIVVLSVVLSGCTSRKVAEDTNYRNGVVFLEKRQYSSALQEFKSSINAFPRNTDSYIKAAEILDDKKQYDDAIVILENGLTSADDVGLINEKLGEIYILKKDYVKAEENLREAMNKNKSSVNAAEKLAYVSILQGKSDEVINILNESSPKDKEGKDRIKYLKALVNATDFENAIDLVQDLNMEDPEIKALSDALIKANETEDNKIEDLMSISYVIINNKDYLFAIKLLEEVIKENEYYHGGQLYSGYIYLNVGEYEKSKEYLEKALELNSSDIATLKYIAQVYVNLNQQKSAIDTYESLIGLEGDNAEIRKDYVNALIIFENYDKAKEQATSLISINPILEHRLVLIKILVDQGDFAGAEAQIIKVVESEEYKTVEDEKKAEILSYQGWILYNNGEKAVGLETLEESLRLSTLFPYTYLYLGSVHLEKEDYQNARTNLEKAVDLDLNGEVSKVANSKLSNIK